MKTVQKLILLCTFLLSVNFVLVSAQASVLLHPKISKAKKNCATSSTIHRDKRFFKPTVFHTPVIDAGGACRLVDENLKVLAKVSCTFKKHCDMQGVCFLKHQKEIIGFNFIKRKHHISIYAKVDSNRCPYGYGIWSKKYKRSICMDPYRSLAADNRYHKPGTVLYFPALKGLSLPNGETHDGYMVVRSTGGAIRGRDRFDFYTGFCENPETKSMLCKTAHLTQSLVKKGFGQTQKMHKDKCFYAYYKVPKSLQDVVLAQRNYPDLPQIDVLSAQVKLGKFANLFPVRSMNEFKSKEFSLLSMTKKETKSVSN